MPFKGLISDLDGVIVNTVPAHFESWQRAFAGFGISFTMKDYEEKVDGIPRMDGARNVAGHLGEEAVAAVARRKQEIYLEIISKGVATYPSTIALFKEAAAAGAALAAVSSSRNCERILRTAEIYDMFDTVVTGNEVTRGKPDPEIFLTAAERLGLTPEDCVVLEDAKLGVEAAKRGGFRCIGIDRHGSPERLAGADRIVVDLAEIDAAFLFRLCSGE